MITKISICVALIFTAHGLAIAQGEEFQSVVPERIPGILRSISKQTKENFEKIHTWQGELDCSRYYVLKGGIAKETFETMTDANGPCPNEVAEITEAIIVFKCDLNKGLWYVKRSREAPTRYIDPATNKDLGTKSLPSSSSEIITKEYQYNAQPDAYNRNDEVAQRKAVKTKKEEPLYKWRQPEYLPRYIFDIDSQVWDRYPNYAKISEEKGKFEYSGLTMKAEQRTLSGDLQYRIHEPFIMNTLNIKGWLINTFSEKAGYNIIDSERITADGKLMLRKSTEYQKVNGVYVPIRDTKDTYDHNRDFSLQIHEEGVFKNIFINDTIPEEIFTYKNLGLKNGDEFIDKIAGKEYKYEDANLVFVSDLPDKSK
ncbi:MAG: hypothetical protein PHQ35_02765 [Phycisphaerae bacterium]|nr:hypothetical protein [Phycisphaerae bacterium]